MTVTIRGRGPSIADFAPELPGLFQDPVIRLMDGGEEIDSNDSWLDHPGASVTPSELVPQRDAEAAITRSLEPGAYTVIMSGSGGTTGIGIIEVFDTAAVAPFPLDTDGDGVPDDSDAFPADPNEHADFDEDGLGDNQDTDDDNDGFSDEDDLFPLDPTESRDNDSDSVGDNADLDDDNDGILDTEDAFPFDSTEHFDEGFLNCLVEGDASSLTEVTELTGSNLAVARRTRRADGDRPPCAARQHSEWRRKSAEPTAARVLRPQW